MPNRAYASFWLKDGSPAKALFQFGRMLQTLPLSESRPGFTELAIQAVSPAETPLLERDLRGTGATAAQVLELAAEYLSTDVCYEVHGWWDLWTYDMTGQEWRFEPHPMEAVCRTEGYDEGGWRDAGHLQLEAGLEHLFTGHAHLLGAGGNHPVAEHPVEAAFVALMSQPERRDIYREKTQANIRKLLDCVERAAAAVELERYALWSEGEEDFEARLEDILAIR
jgi:hypothetical protein